MSRRALRIGIDLDNTIVCYDAVFHELASSRGVISAALPATKEAVRQHLRRRGMEDVWTEMQGEAYGPRMADAPAFLGVREFFASCAPAGAALFIVSHRTAVPFVGPAHDLHAAAHHWLADARLLENANGCVYLETTRQAKLQRIRDIDPDYFIDDQAEILLDAAFPRRTVAVLFDPHHRENATDRLRRAAHVRAGVIAA